jgi:hypothetical protein
MKIIIEHSRTKRLITGPFRVCGDHNDLREIANQILQQIGDSPGYGWKEVVETVKQPDDGNFAVTMTRTQKTVCVDSSPLPWDS